MKLIFSVCSANVLVRFASNRIFNSKNFNLENSVKTVFLAKYLKLLKMKLKNDISVDLW